MSTPSSPDKMMSANGRRAAVLMLVSSMSIFFTFRDALPLTVSTLTTVDSDSSNSRSIKRHSPSQNKTLIDSSIDAISSSRTLSPVTKRDLPIYLLQPDTESVSQITWGTLAAEWNRTTAYTDLMRISQPASSLPGALPGERPVVMIHCGPKSGSTTLREACRFNLQNTCGIKKEGRMPKGYMNETELYPLIRSCTETSHFCTKETVMPMDVPTFNNTLFIHMFPFRTYNDWAASALKQAYDRGGENGCNKAKQLIDECTPSRMEIDFRKYGKTDLSKFKELAVSRMNEKKEAHIFILYYHRDLDKVLSMLSRVYNIQQLPGSNGKGKLNRPEGTCDESILEKFHDCFSSQLMELA